jgi:diguanylate cyclase (GGDEF)-like protein
MNWSVLPDLAAVGLLAAAFASVARHGETRVSRIWLTGWLMIVLHFSAALFENATGTVGVIANIVILSSLTSAGLLFMWASVPYRKDSSSFKILVGLLVANTLYITLSMSAPVPDWTLNISASLFCILPLSVALATPKLITSPLRWTTVGLYSMLAVYVLAFQHRPGNGGELAINAVLFTVYIGCCIHFWYAYRRGTAGAVVTIAGFFTWAMVFVVAPLMNAYFPSVPIENEVWNLPKYLVALGMILLLLEDQIEHNKHLALHDHLTGLPNRRLYQDRLHNALERARRSQAQTALLVIDLDHFKHVNDTLGHHVGDLVLKRVATLFASRVRRSDTVARTGGDEFSVILEEPVSRADAMQVGRSLVKLLHDPLELGEHTVQIGASVGIAVFPEDAHEMEALCIAADLRMYDAKHIAHLNDGPETSRKSRTLARLEPQAQSSSPGIE